MRHGKSDWSSDALTDFSRPLATRGRKAVPKMGRWLDRKGVRLDLVISSPAVRAKQTALIIAPRLDYPESEVVWDERLYMADCVTLLQVLAECPADRPSVLLVGHNPGMEDLLSYLAGPKCLTPEQGTSFPTAAVGIVELPEDWHNLEQDAAIACDIHRPKEL